MLEQFLGALRGVQPGQTVDLTVLRNGESVDLKITIGRIER